MSRIASWFKGAPTALLVTVAAAVAIDLFVLFWYLAKLLQS